MFATRRTPGYRGFGTLGEEFIVLRRLRGEREKPAVDEAADRDMPPTSEAVRMAALAFTGPLVVMGWWLTSHAQTGRPAVSRGVILATAFILVYLAVEAAGAGGFVAIGLAATVTGLAWPGLANLPRRGNSPVR